MLMCYWAGMYLVWICTDSDWLMVTEDFSDLSNFLLSMLPSCIASVLDTCLAIGA